MQAEHYLLTERHTCICSITDCLDLIIPQHFLAYNQCFDLFRVVPVQFGYTSCMGSFEPFQFRFGDTGSLKGFLCVSVDSLEQDKVWFRGRMDPIVPVMFRFLMNSSGLQFGSCGVLPFILVVLFVCLVPRPFAILRMSSTQVGCNRVRQGDAVYGHVNTLHRLDGL